MNFYNLKPFDFAREHQGSSEAPFLKKQCEHARINKPYRGLKILHNIPLSLETICKLEPLLLGGADLTVTINRAIQPSTQSESIQLLKAIGVPFAPLHPFERSFDFVLDCGGEFADREIARRGIVELTQTGSQLYKALNLSVPMISVDDSLLKQLETFFGTGDGCLRALEKLIGADFIKKHYLLFGYGKVGQGIAHFLTKVGAKVAIVDIDPEKLSTAIARGFLAFHLDNDHSEIEAMILKSDVVLTATGVKNLLSTSFKKAYFKEKILANLGVEDEFGSLFDPEEVLFKKQPINFSTSIPTKMRYLDPSFYAHNTGIDYILNNDLAAGYHPFPEEMDLKIVKEWQEIFGEDISLLRTNSMIVRF